MLVVCGFDHLRGLVDQLGDGDCVESVDYRKENWYRDDVFFNVSF